MFVFRKKTTISLSSAMTMTMTKKKMAEEAREGVQIKQEEELQKREKTLMDEEAAQMEREKLHEKK